MLTALARCRHYDSKKEKKEKRVLGCLQLIPHWLGADIVILRNSDRKPAFATGQGYTTEKHAELQDFVEVHKDARKLGVVPAEQSSIALKSLDSRPPVPGCAKSHGTGSRHSCMNFLQILTCRQ